VAKKPKLGKSEQTRVILSTGDKYQLCISKPERDPRHRVEIGIRLKAGTFDVESNYIAVLVEDEMLRVIIRDLQSRLGTAH